MKVAKVFDENYLRLIARVPLLPVETEKDYKLAKSLLHELMQRDESLEPSEIGYAKVLAKLIQDYSKYKSEGLFKQQIPGNKILQSLMDDHNLNQVDIAEITGMQKQNVNAYLKGHRPLPQEAREHLGKRFYVNPEIFSLRTSSIDTDQLIMKKLVSSSKGQSTRYQNRNK